MERLRSNYIPELKHVIFTKYDDGTLEVYWDSKMPFLGIDIESTTTIRPNNHIEVVVMKRDKSGNVKEREALTSTKEGIYPLFDDLFLKLKQRDSEYKLGGILEPRSSAKLSDHALKITWEIRDETPGTWSSKGV